MTSWIEKHAAMLRAGGALTAVLTGLLLAAQQLEVPSEAAWDDHGDPLFYVLVASVTLAFSYGIFDAIDEPARSRRSQLELEAKETDRGLQLLCRRAFVPINARFPNIAISKIGVHVWRVAPDKSELHRVYKFTMELERIDTPLRWTPGRGAIGRAWASREVQTESDLDLLAAQAGHMTDAEFDALPEGERCGLSRRDVLASSRYKAILAVPLFARTAAGDNDPPVVGVLSVDFLASVPVEGLAYLAREDLQFGEILAACQNLLGAID